MAAEFEQAGAQLLGINVDSFFCQQAFADKLGLNFPLLSDFNREVIPQYTGFYEVVAGSLKGVGKRAAFVVDQQGVIRYRWVSEDPGILPDPDDLLKAVRSA